MTDGARSRGLYTALLVGVGLASAFVAGSFWPLIIALGAAAVAWPIAAPRRLAPPSAEDDASRALLSRLEGDLRRRHLEIERTADEIRLLLSRSGRDPSLWQAEVKRVEDLIHAHLLLATRVQEDEAFSDDEDALEAKVHDLKLRSPQSDVARELSRVEERLELARARKARVEERRAHLSEIESGLALVRDRVAALDPQADLGPEIEALMGGVEAAAAAELETSRLVAGASRRAVALDRPGGA